MRKKARLMRKPATKRSRRSTRANRRANSKPAAAAVGLRKKKEIADPQLRQIMKVYGEAMREFNRQNFRRAKAMLEKVVASSYRQLADRARVHLTICEQRVQRSEPVKLRSADDYYHYAVSQINAGRFEEARASLERAAKLSPRADYVYYALASLAALRGEPEIALGHLERAIQLRPENRFQARHDVDFHLLAENSRFRELTGSGTNSLRL